MADDRKKRRGRALQMHLAGASYQQIVDALGYSSKSVAFKDVRSAMDDLGSPSADSDQIKVGLARLDVALTAIWPKVRSGELGAVDRFLKIEDQRSKLLAAAGVKYAAPVVEAQSEVTQFERLVAERKARAEAARPSSEG